MLSGLAQGMASPAMMALFNAHTLNQMRFNLWIDVGDCRKVVCYGSRGEMNDLALSLTGVPGDVHVLPDCDEPGDTRNCQVTTDHFKSTSCETSNV